MKGGTAVSKNIKILVSCHKPSKVADNPLLQPIEVGCATRKKHPENMLRDNDGENISEKNPMYCELTAQYWAWKNLDADYYGFFHYRRYMNFSGKRYITDGWQNVIEDKITPKAIKKYAWTEAEMRPIIESCDLIITEEKNVAKMPDRNRSVYEQYKHGHSLNIRDLEIVRKIIAEKYPDYLEDFNTYLEGTETCLCNMYIMKKELFQAYMPWLFDILSEFEKRADMSDYSVEGYRTPGHLAERLLTLYYLHLKKSGKYKIKTLQTVVILNTDYKKPLKELQATKPAFEENNIAIALASNDYFVPYMATMLQSIVAHADPEKNYDVLILTQDISEVNQKRLKDHYADQKNVSLRFLDPTSVIEGYDFFVRGHFSMETYYRLVLPEVLLNYEKILYLDSDMVAETDVAPLYEEDVSGYLLAACHDADTAGLYNGFEKGKKAYTDKVLKLKEPYQYFQAGVLLLNLEEFRKRFTTEKILRFAVSEKWQLLDQDILNKLCEGRVKYVDMAWNVMVDYGGIRKNQIIALAPKWLNDMYLEARKQQKIIHYAGPEKPWLYPEMDQGPIFWEYAKQTGYYEIMLSRMSQNWSALASRQPHNIVAGGIQCVRDHGLRYTIKYLPKKLMKK